MSVELHPPVAVDKGTVLAELASGLAAACFIGDDAGDLPAFDALDELAEAGGGHRPRGRAQRRRRRPDSWNEPTWWSTARPVWWPCSAPSDCTSDLRRNGEHHRPGLVGTGGLDPARRGSRGGDEGSSWSSKASPSMSSRCSVPSSWST